MPKIAVIKPKSAGVLPSNNPKKQEILKPPKILPPPQATDEDLQKSLLSQRMITAKYAQNGFMGTSLGFSRRKIMPQGRLRGGMYRAAQNMFDALVSESKENKSNTAMFVFPSITMEQSSLRLLSMDSDEEVREMNLFIRKIESIPNNRQKKDEVRKKIEELALDTLSKIEQIAVDALTGEAMKKVIDPIVKRAVRWGKALLSTITCGISEVVIAFVEECVDIGKDITGINPDNKLLALVAIQRLTRNCIKTIEELRK